MYVCMSTRLLHDSIYRPIYMASLLLQEYSTTISVYLSSSNSIYVASTHTPPTLAHSTRAALEHDQQTKHMHTYTHTGRDVTTAPHVCMYACVYVCMCVVLVVLYCYPRAVTSRPPLRSGISFDTSPFRKYVYVCVCVYACVYIHKYCTNAPALRHLVFY